MSDFFRARARRKIALGAQLVRATATLPQSGNHALFTITGGKILMTSIQGEVTVDIGGTDNVKLTAYPTLTTAGDTDLCTAIDIDTCVVGDVLGITGTPGEALLVAHKGVVQQMLTGGVILQTGALHLVADASRTGSIKWKMTYIPLDDGAEVTVA